MMKAEDLLSAASVRWALAASSRKSALDLAANVLAKAHPEVSARGLFNALIERERLGSTGLGEGVAIPHCRLACSCVLGALISLRQPVDFDAIDGQPVDLLFILVAPRDEPSAHLEVLRQLAAILGDEDVRALLRGAGSGRQLLQRFIEAAQGQSLREGWDYGGSSS